MNRRRWRRRTWQLPWLRLHLLTRELLEVRVNSPAWPRVKAELRRCAELRGR